LLTIQRFEIVNGVIEVEGVPEVAAEETPAEDKAPEGL